VSRRPRGGGLARSARPAGRRLARAVGLVASHCDVSEFVTWIDLDSNPGAFPALLRSRLARWLGQRPPSGRDPRPGAAPRRQVKGPDHPRYHRCLVRPARARACLAVAPLRSHRGLAAASPGPPRSGLASNAIRSCSSGLLGDAVAHPGGVPLARRAGSRDRSSDAGQGEPYRACRLGAACSRGHF
jgi:hypothetical protein